MNINPYDDMDDYFGYKINEIITRNVGDLQESYAANMTMDIIENMELTSDETVARILWYKFSKYDLTLPQARQLVTRMRETLLTKLTS